MGARARAAIRKSPRKFRAVAILSIRRGPRFGPVIEVDRIEAGRHLEFTVRGAKAREVFLDVNYEGSSTTFRRRHCLVDNASCACCPGKVAQPHPLQRADRRERWFRRHIICPACASTCRPDPKDLEDIALGGVKVDSSRSASTQKKRLAGAARVLRREKHRRIVAKDRGQSACANWRDDRNGRVVMTARGDLGIECRGGIADHKGKIVKRF